MAKIIADVENRQVVFEGDKETYTLKAFRVIRYRDLGDFLQGNPTAAYLHSCATPSRSQVEWGHKSDKCSKKGAEAFREHTGMWPKDCKRVLNACLDEVFIKPIHYHCQRHCFDPRGINPHKVRSVWQMKDELDQAKADGIYNITPFIVGLKKNPKELKQLLGSLWKKLCKNSFTRNKALWQGSSDEWQYSAPEHCIAALRDSLERCNELPSSVLTSTELFRHVYQTRKQLDMMKALYTAKGNLAYKADRDKIVRNLMIIKDTVRMCRRHGRKYRKNWSMEKWHEEHQRVAQIGRNAQIARMEKEKLERNKCMVEDWDAMYYPTAQHGAYKATPIHSYQGMIDEGIAMNHCVASYAMRVYRGDSAVYSVTKNGKRSSTLSFSIRCKQDDAGQEYFKIVKGQHYGYGNDLIEDEDEAYIAEILACKLTEHLNTRKEENVA